MTFTDADRDAARRAADCQPGRMRLVHVYVALVIGALMLGLVLGMRA